MSGNNPPATYSASDRWEQFSFDHGSSYTSEMHVKDTLSMVNEKDKLIGLNLGADDYIVKPFSPNEMIARVNALFQTEEEVYERTIDALVNNIRKLIGISGNKTGLIHTVHDVGYKIE